MTPDEESTLKVSRTLLAIESGQIRVPMDAPWVRELLNAPRTPLGLVDISRLSPHTISSARATSLTLGMAAVIESRKQGPALSAEQAQSELFRHFRRLFAALTGTGAEYVNNDDEVRQRLVRRATEEFDVLARTFNAAADELAAFYRENGIEMLRYAQRLGGVKTVAGGQKQLTGTAVTATRIAGLYADTQLVPDPVFPFITGDLQLNAQHLQLALVLHHLLQLEPLVLAQLPVPPVVVFPSFEEPLERGDPTTIAGLESLCARVVAPACEMTGASLRDLFTYAAKERGKFVQQVMKANLFVPLGRMPGEVRDGVEALRIHFEELKGVRAQQQLDELMKLPPGVAMLQFILERLRPQYHLFENANGLDAQPLMCLPVQWHYYELCAKVSAQELVRDRVLSEGSFATLRALQDDSVTWLANIPMEGLVELRKNSEHQSFRDELKKYTVQLTAAGTADLDSTVKEVNNGLASLIQRHRKEMNAVQAKYAPKAWGAAAGAAVGAGAAILLLPALTPFLTIGAPGVIAAGALGGGAVKVVSELASGAVEKGQNKHSLLGMLATAKMNA